MKPPSGKDGNVIKGPWPDPSVKISDVDGVAVVEELEWAENLTEGIMVQMIVSIVILLDVDYLQMTYYHNLH